MSYAMSYMIKLGTANSGLALIADLYDYNNTLIQSGIQTYFYPRSNGEYFWYYPSFSDGFRGYVQVYTSGSYMTSFAVNPEDGEYIDAKISSVTDTLGGGSFIFDVYSRDNDNEPVGYTTVEIRPSGQSSLAALGFTSTNAGKATFNLSSGLYSVYLYNLGIATWDNPYYVEISQDDTLIASGIRISTPSYPDPTLTRIYAYVNDLGLEPQEGVTMKVYPLTTTYGDNSTLFTQAPVNVRSDDNGYLYHDVVGGQEVRVVISQANYEKEFTTPASGMINILEA